MTKAEKAHLASLSPEALLEAFVFEAKLSEPGKSPTVARMNKHAAVSRSYSAEIIARGGESSLITLLAYPDNWIAYCAAAALVVHDETKDVALATLDRIAEECSGSASSFANRGRNMIRYGDPLGADWVGRP